MAGRSEALDPLDDSEAPDAADAASPAAGPYAALEVSSTATAAEIRLAYLQRVREHPPERDPEGFKRIREAYEVLRSPRKRAELTLLELGDLATTFDQATLRETPPPPFPAAFVEHLLAAALAEVDAAVDAEVAHLASVSPPGGAPAAGPAAARR